MRFTAERDVLLPALSFVRKYAASNAKIPILADLLIEARDGRVTLTATDLDQSAMDSFPAEVTHPGAITVSAAGLHDAIKSAVGTDVVMDADDRQVRVSCGKSKFKLSIMPGHDFPRLPMLAADGATSFTIPNLVEIDRRVLFAAEPDKGRYYLAGVSWKVVGGKIEFVATDGKKFSLLSAPVPAEARDMPAIIVPRFDAPAWTGDVDVSISANFIRYRQGSQVVASKLVDGTYPDYHRLIPTNETSVLFDRAELVAAVARMAIVTNTGESSVLFVGRNGVVTVSAKSGEREATDEIAYNGDDFQIAIIHQVIAPILASFDCETIEWRWSGHDTGVTIHDPKDDGRIAFAMPYRDSRLGEFITSAFRDAAE